MIAGGFAGLVLSFAVRSALLAVLVGGALWVLRERDAAVRYAAWRLVLVALLILPLGSLLVPAIPLPAPIVVRSVAVHLPVVRMAIPALTGLQTVATDRPQPAETPFSWMLLRLGFYLAITGALLSRILVGRLMMRRAASSMQRYDDPRLLECVNRQCDRLGLLTFPDLRGAATVRVPVTFGWRTPVVLLPEDWQAWPVEKLDAVLAHELSHIQRGDYLIRFLSAFNRALYWFHPLSWWLDRHLAELSEQLSDDAALAATSQPRERYAGILNDFAGQFNRHGGRFGLGIAMSVSARGGRRMRRILDPHRTLSVAPTTRKRLAVWGLGIPALILVAGAQVSEQAHPPANVAQPGVPIGSPIGRHVRVPPPIFSQAYADALRNILDLEPEDVADLEARLAKDPDDFAARLQLVAYCRRGDREGLPESRNRRAQLVLWLVEHRPDSEILASPYATFSDGELTADQMQRALRLWDRAITPRQADARVMWNAANFYRPLDRQKYLTCLERSVALAPENANYAQPLGLFYAGVILTTDPRSMYREPGGAMPALVRHATEVLDTTNNFFLLEPAVKLLHNEYLSSLMRANENVPLGALARRYFERAKALDPEIDEAWILPKIDPKMIGMLAAGARPPAPDPATFEQAATQIRRRQPDELLPAPVRSVLHDRGCRIPQPNADGPLRNVIQGEFFEKDHPAWAVLCSAGGSSSILVFRGDADGHPEELAKGEDKFYLQGMGGGKIAYSREISVADRKFIMGHYRAYGGPAPPPIDHHGIDDSFLEKASVTYYWHEGKWLKLQGAD